MLGYKKSIKCVILMMALMGWMSSVFAKPILWGEDISPFVRKVHVILKEKGIPYDHIEVLPISVLKATEQEIPSKFEQISPLGKVPALEDGDFGIADSAVIAQYLEAKYPDTKKIFPSQPEALARTLWFENYADNVIGTAMKHIFLEAYVKPKILKVPGEQALLEQGLKEELPAVLNYLENEVGQHEWIASDEFTVADIAIATHFVSLKQAGVEVDAKQYPKFAKYLEKVLARESFKGHI